MSQAAAAVQVVVVPQQEPEPQVKEITVVRVLLQQEIQRAAAVLAQQVATSAAVHSRLRVQAAQAAQVLQAHSSLPIKRLHTRSVKYLVVKYGSQAAAAVAEILAALMEVLVDSAVVVQALKLPAPTADQDCLLLAAAAAVQLITAHLKATVGQVDRVLLSSLYQPQIILE